MRIDTPEMAPEYEVKPAEAPVFDESPKGMLPPLEEEGIELSVSKRRLKQNRQKSTSVPSLAGIAQNNNAFDEHT